MIRFRDISLRNKIFFSIIGVVLCVSVAIALLARWILISSLTTELEHRGVAIAQAMAERGRGYVLDNDADNLLTLIFDAAELGERKSLVSYVFVSDMEHKVLAHTFVQAFPDELRTANDIPKGAPNSVKLLYAGAEPTYDVAVPMEEGLYQVATVHVGLNKRHIDKLVEKLRTTFLGFIFAAIIIIFLVSLRVSRSITQPLVKLIKMSDEITRGNLSFKLDLGRQYEDFLSEHGDTEPCPAYHDSVLPCWYVDKALGPVSPSSPRVKKPPYCTDCLIRHRQFGDEIMQLADSFVYMVRSVKLYRNRLGESEAKYRSMFDAGPDPIFILARDTLDILDANPRAESAYGYTKDELMGMSFKKLESRDGAVSLGDFKKHLDQPGACVFYPKVTHYKKDGRPFFVNMHACDTRYGAREAIILSITDITEMVEKDAQLIQAGKMATLGEMSAGIAHELNQPLNAIKMGSDFLGLQMEMGRAVSERDLQTVAREISVQVDRASEIIDTLRQFSLKADMFAEKLNLNEPVRNVLKMVSPQLELQNIKLRLELFEPLPKIRASGNRLQQVFFNLVSNARDAINMKSDQDGVPFDRVITIRSFTENGRVAMSVSDTGAGIEQSKLEKIFEPFFSTKEEALGGMGLGLAISHGIVKDYGGDIAVESDIKKGTTFKLSFPTVS